jgi:hypothetical protein
MLGQLMKALILFMFSLDFESKNQNFHSYFGFQFILIKEKIAGIK